MADYSKDLYDYKYECNRNCSAFDDGYKKGASDMEQAKQIIIDALNREIDRVQEQNKWHLCSDGDLPNDRRTVLVVAYWHETYRVMEGSYYGDGLVVVCSI